MGENSRMPPDEKPNGDMLPMKMLETLLSIQKTMEENQRLMRGFGELLYELNGYLATFDKAMEILENQTGTSRQKLTINDFSKAWEVAADEIMGEEGEEEDEGDPRVGVETG